MELIIFLIIIFIAVIIKNKFSNSQAECELEEMDEYLKNPDDDY